MSENLTYSTIFVELDTLFDTRLATLAILGFDHVTEAIKNDYYDRFIDIFPKVDEKLYEELYSKRNKLTLKASYISNVAYILKDFVKKTILQANGTPFQYKPKVVINIHPYELDEEEITNIILGVKEVTLGLADIEVVNLSYEEITPSYVKRELSIIILYEYYKWLEAHALNENFKKVTCPEVCMLAPAIYFKKPEGLRNTNEDPFKAMEELVAPFIMLKLLPIETFSLARKLTVKED